MKRLNTFRKKTRKYQILIFRKEFAIRSQRKHVHIHEILISLSLRSFSKLIDHKIKTKPVSKQKSNIINEV